MQQITQLYDQQILQGFAREDAAQRRALAVFEDLLKLPSLQKSGWRSFFKKKPAQGEASFGLYLFGQVGRGKSFLMDLFVQCAGEKVRRVHYHDFMKQVHELLKAIREEMLAGALKEGDPVPYLVDRLFDDLNWLCLDEFMVHDIADAMILGRLLQGLFDKGVRLVTTSNVQPDLLYKDGINRDLFLPTIASIQSHLKVQELSAEQDYRLGRGEHRPYWLLKHTAESMSQFEDAWRTDLEGVKPRPRAVNAFGRTWPIEMWAQGAGRMRFAQLCEQAMGANDYLALAQHVHTLYLEDVPLLDEVKRSAAKRFITLIDALYDNKVQLVVLADVPIGELFAIKSGEESFASMRTISRLIEMGSKSYLDLKRDVHKQWQNSHLGVAQT